LFERGEAGAVLARFHFGDERCLVGTQRVNVDVMSATAKVTGPGQWIAFGLDAKCSVQGDDLALNAIALATVTRAAHVQFAPFRWFICLVPLVDERLKDRMSPDG
jgi:hypothetical protein